MTCKYLFTYGTLSPDFDLIHKFELPYKDLGNAFVYGKKLLNSIYPAVVKSNHENVEKITGHLLELHEPEVAFKKLDAYEEYYPEKPGISLYLRELTDAYLIGSQEKISCWIYWANENNSDLMN